MAWLVLLITALLAVGRRAGEFVEASTQVLAPANLGWLIGSFILIKLAHELGHGFACKVLGKRERSTGAAGECHELGVLLIVLLPIPYVDASSSWTLRSRWRRIIVNGAGMYFEVAIASVAALVWASTGVGSQVNTLAYNAVLLAGVTTILFNANPLLRYDGYYILSDLFEAPNLYQRSRDAIYYYVKKYAFKAREPKDPALNPGPQLARALRRVVGNLPSGRAAGHYPLRRRPALRARAGPRARRRRHPVLRANRPARQVPRERRRDRPDPPARC
ncbi:MAG: hypothetical protein ACFHWZ_17210 [Phycisphaerales bacterium]